MLKSSQGQYGTLTAKSNITFLSLLQLNKKKMTDLPTELLGNYFTKKACVSQFLSNIAQFRLTTVLTEYIDLCICQKI